MQPETNSDQSVESQTQELQDQAAPAAPVEDTQDTENTEVDSPEQSQEGIEAPESDTQLQSATAEVIPEPEEDEPEFIPQATQIPTIEQVDISKFIDANGNFDAVAYNQALQSQIAQETASAVAQATAVNTNVRLYEKEWDKAYDKFPQLKGNTPEAKRQRAMVQAIHAQSANPGQKYLSPSKAAAELFGFASEQRKVGRQAATESRTVQAAANLGQSTPPAPATSSKNDDLKGKMRHAKTAKERADAAHELLKQIV